MDASDHVDDLFAGYRAMQRCLVANRGALLSATGPVAPFQTAPVRFIARDTWSCQTLIARSLAPALLADVVEREIFLQQLYRPTFARDGDGSPEQHPHVVGSEIDAIRDLDVPLFSSRPNSTAVFAGPRELVAGYFDGTAWDRLQQRLDELPSFPTETELDFIRTAFATCHRRSDNGKRWRDGSEPRHPITPAAGAWVELARDIGARILADGIPGHDGSLSWLGTVYHPHIDLLSLKVLESDLLTGTCGLAVLFSDLFDVTLEQRWRTAALAALQPTIRELRRAPTTWRDVERSRGARRTPLYCGALLGTGAQLFTVSYCAALLDMPELQDVVGHSMAEFRPDALAPHMGSDLVSGIAGLLLTLVPWVHDGHAWARDITRHLARYLDERAATDRLLDPPYPDEQRLSGLPGTRAGILLALARLQPVPGDPKTSAEGTVGSLLAALEIARLTGSDQGALLDEVDHFLAQPAAPSGAAFVDLLELVITASDLAGDRYQDTAVGVAQRLCQAHASSGSWLPASFGAETHDLSIVWGLPAVARAFLRLHDPSRIPSLRLVQMPTRP